MDFGRKHLEGTEIFREKLNGHWAIWRFRVCRVDFFFSVLIYGFVGDEAGWVFSFGFSVVDRMDVDFGCFEN
jgi:hypothetical protein